MMKVQFLTFLILLIAEESSGCVRIKCRSNGNFQKCFHRSITPNHQIIRISSNNAIIPGQNNIPPKSCKKGHSFGFRRRSMWVDLKCRGTFNVCFLPLSRVSCTNRKLESTNYKNTTYTIDLNDRVRVMSVWTKYSIKPCIAEKTYGKGGRRVWVDDGCRAKFRLCVINT